MGKRRIWQQVCPARGLEWGGRSHACWDPTRHRGLQGTWGCREKLGGYVVLSPLQPLHGQVLGIGSVTLQAWTAGPAIAAVSCVEAGTPWHS